MKWTVRGIGIEAVPAYTVKTPERGETHPKGECNGYIADKRVYIASETAVIPELKNISDIDITFLAMDVIYNISPEEAVEAVNMFKPWLIYPYHFNKADLTPFIEAFADNLDIGVRVRDMGR